MASMRVLLESLRKSGLALLLAASASAAAPSVAAGPVHATLPGIVPRPLAMDTREGAFALDGGVAIVVASDSPQALGVGRYLSEQLARARGLKLPVRVVPAGTPAVRAIVFRLDPLPPDTEVAVEAEAYSLEIGPRAVLVRSHDAHGLFDGAVSLLQLATTDGRRGSQRLASLHVEDRPRFQWRGLMLDSARHMQSVAEIKRFIDAMALHKLDVLQWHLTDDQGWRLEIRKYPKLTEIGAWRRPAGAAGTDAQGKQVRYGGFYTQEQAREIVRYAATRFITVVPEIDLPGHAQAAVAAYPELGNVASAPPVSPDWGVHTQLFNVEEPTLRFLEDVLGETMEIFPSPFIHVGGDEAVKDQWKASPRVQARMKELGIADEAKLQGWLTARMQAFLAAHHRRLIGWDEILEGGLPADAAVMSWRGVDGAIAATKGGHDSVLSPWPLLYFDNRQGTGAGEPPGRLHVVSLKDVYDFDPLPASMSVAQGRHLLGVQGNVWTEHIRTFDRVMWMSFPRAAAIAEVGWTAPQWRLWPDFERRLPALYASYDALGIAHADSAFAPVPSVSYAGTPMRATVQLAKQAAVGDIRYTLDGSEPGAASRRYSEALSLALPATLKTATFAGSQRLSRTTTLPLRREDWQRRRASELKQCSENIALGLEDDAPAIGPRAVFALDIQNPCWIFPQADLDAAGGVVASVGSVPFNFQIGDLVDKIVFPTPRTPEGELLVLLDSCDGEELARLPLAPAAKNPGLTRLPAMALKPAQGRHDVCLRFAQPALQPMYALDWVKLTDKGKP
jgi:hexosaminidase